ncbi:glycosyltransferase family 1 protein [Acinetobacter sp. MD2]|uniref:glycosyltransferase family 4 protein n=1 Tax=Acinetobacter sp. MD2 TaxID=2600066 RepID=UPI002D1E5BBF|nr:glycosyltransferase family 1 protein [Acinetobacter sp. MD2]MEB3767059.1 glycosyltransferase family 1 protein [Acinetobacter sp. MD2]
MSLSNVFKRQSWFWSEWKHKSFHNVHAIQLPRVSDQKLKIAMVTETWPPELNGVAQSLMYLCQGLQNKGHQILLIRPEQSQISNQFTPTQQCLVAAQRLPKYPYLQFGVPQYSKVRQAIKDFQPDVIHVVTEGPLGLLGLQIAHLENIPLSSGFHSPFHEFSRFFDLAFLVKPIQHYLRWFHNQTQLTCVPNHDTAHALKQYGIDCPLVVVGRGVDVQHFSADFRSQALRESWRADEQTTVLLYVGRLSPEKQIDQIITNYLAQKQQGAENLALIIVGDGPDRARLQALDVAQNIIFTGALTGVALAQAYASADVFVFASQVETFGNVVLEAMASGLPVLAYDYACAHQYIEQGQTGWKIPLQRADLFKQQFEQFPALAQLHKMGVQAQLSVQHVGWEHPIRQFEQALQSVVQHFHYGFT